MVEVALVHRRLSIIDHDDGVQPMVSPCGRGPDEGLLAVVFNGCIYNHRALRAQLQSRGHRFATDHSDTEVLLHGHREWGDSLQQHLEGMYAFALWDRGAASLTLARDWFGEKPLYYRCQGESGRVERLAAASVSGAVASIPPASAANDATLRQWVRTYLQLGYAGGSGPTLGGPGVAVEAVRPSGPFGDGARIEAGESIEPRQIEDLIEQAVARRLEADVPLGCFLSGGVDSSLIAYFARKHKQDLRTFCVRMPDPRYDESEQARQVAEHLGTDHVTLDAASSPTNDLVKLIGLLGQPFGDSSILPTYWVSKAASAHVKVALSGDGGDELFVGYERYLAARLLARHWRLLRRIPSAFLRLHPKSRLHKLGRLGGMARDYPTHGLLAAESIFTASQIDALLGDGPVTETPPEVGGDALAALRRADLGGYLPGDLLRKVDTASMAVALEVRAPYLDRDLASALLAAPVKNLIPGGKRKGLLRRIARRHLPAEIVDRPKMGFAVPIGQWFRADVAGMRSLLLDHLHSVEPFGPVGLERRVIRRLIDEHMAAKRDHGHRLFTLLTLSIWARSSSQGPAVSGQ